MTDKQKRTGKARGRALLADEGRTLRLYGIVGDDWDGFTDDSVAMMLDQTRDLNTIRLNSPGGFVHQGMAIYALLSERPGLTVKVDGLAASMGSVIAMAGARVEMNAGAMMMIHNPWNVVGGDAEEFRKNAAMLDKVKQSILAIYAAKTGQEQTLLAEMMDEETWLTAEEAVEWGFADAIVEAGTEAPEAIAQLDLSLLKTVPDRVAAMAKTSTKTEVSAAALGSAKEHTESEAVTVTITDQRKPAVDPPRTEAQTSTQEGDVMTEEVRAQAQKEAVADERKRAKEIRAAVSAAKLDTAFADQLCESDASIDDARAQVIAKLAEQSGPEINNKSRGGFGERDETKTQRDAVALALLNRYNPQAYKIDGSHPARQFASMSLREMARSMAENAGVDTRDMTAYRVAKAALTHTSSDFPLILENVVGKVLREAYDLAPRTFTAMARQSTLPDYKEVSRVQLGEAPTLQKVLEGGEYSYGTVGEAAEKYRLFKYGKILSITAETIINDDLDAFTRIPFLMGASAAQLESELFWADFNGNPTMSDSIALFHDDHGNLAGTGAVISIDSIGAGRARMRQQKGLDGKHFISVQPSFLLVPTALETKAEQFVSTNLMPTKNADVNVFANRLQVISEPRLDATSATAWYLVANPGMAGIDTFEYAYLQGEEGPVIETEDGFDRDGVKVKVRHSFGVKALDWRGLDKNPGA